MRCSGCAGANREESGVKGGRKLEGIIVRKKKGNLGEGLGVQERKWDFKGADRQEKRDYMLYCGLRFWPWWVLALVVLG